MESKNEYIKDGNGVLYLNKEKQGKQPDYEGPLSIILEWNADGTAKTERKTRIKIWKNNDSTKDYNFSVQMSHKKEIETEAVPF